MRDEDRLDRHRYVVVLEEQGYAPELRLRGRMPARIDPGAAAEAAIERERIYAETTHRITVIDLVKAREAGAVTEYRAQADVEVKLEPVKQDKE